MKRFFSLMLLFAGTSTAAAVEPVPTDVVPRRIEGAKPRSVVFILSDDHRYDAMSFMGHQFARDAAHGRHGQRMACI